jgi:hypothetical protein
MRRFVVGKPEYADSPSTDIRAYRLLPPQVWRRLLVVKRQNPPDSLT